MLTEERAISPEQLGELTKKFVACLSRRSHAEGCALMESRIGWHIKEFLDELGDFTCDLVKSELTYPAAYKGLRPVEEQIHLLAAQFQLDPGPALKFLENGLPAVPKWAEGWAALPIHERCRGTWIDNVYKALIWHSGVCGNRPGRYYGCGATEGLCLENHVRPYYVGPGLEKARCTRRRFAQDWKRWVGGNIMIVPVQMGAMRRGQSDRMVKACCKRDDMSEFPLGMFEVACLLAMHPERVSEYRENALAVNAPGDEYTFAGFMKTANCRHKQMGQFIKLSAGRLPAFAFGWDNLQDARNGPVTASSWSLRSWLLNRPR